jgi:D-alanine-D-alanine ligase
MPLTLQKLTTAQLDSLNLLFLASRAPQPSDAIPPLDSNIGIHPRYNYELFKVIEALGINVTSCNNLEEFIAVAPQYNYVFTIYNRAPFHNSEVFVSTLCEYFHIPYLGAPPNIRALAEDKYFTKLVAAALHIPVTPSKIYNTLEDTDSPPEFSGPYFIKPRFGAASEDISVDSVQELWQEARPRVITMLTQGKACLVEQCVAGTDITVPILGGNPAIILPAAEEISELPFGISTFRQKRLLEPGRQRCMLEAPHLNAQLIEYAQKFFPHLHPFDYIRMDFRLDTHRQQLFLLEFNLGCNLGSHAAIAQSARHVGISQADLINHLISYSLQRQAKGGDGK